MCSVIDWNTHLALTSTAKWLHSYYSTHKTPFPVKVTTLKTAMASETKNVGAFRIAVREALAMLVECEFFLSAKIDPKSDLVIVERKFDRRLIE